jgi:hypothetical protein
VTLWTILECFGYEDLPERLNGDGIHSLDNIMTLDPIIHDWFDRLEIWFEAVVSNFKFLSPICAKRDDTFMLSVVVHFLSQRLCITCTGWYGKHLRCLR